MTTICGGASHQAPERGVEPIGSPALCLQLTATSKQIKYPKFSICSERKKESWNVSWILFSIADKFLYRRSWVVIYLGWLLPDISCGSPNSEGEKDQPYFLRPCSLLGFTEPVPLDTAGALLPHLCTLTNFHWRYFSVALSSRSLALGVIQQAWSFGSPDFPQTCLKDRSATTSPTLSFI